MSYMRKYKGKHVTYDPVNPQSIGFCQRSRSLFNHKDLVMQTEWFGDNKVPINIWVGKPYLDIPNEQGRPPLVKADPQPVTNPGPLLPHSPPPPNVLPYNQLIAKLNNFHWGS